MIQPCPCARAAVTTGQRPGGPGRRSLVAAMHKKPTLSLCVKVELPWRLTAQSTTPSLWVASAPRQLCRQQEPVVCVLDPTQPTQPCVHCPHPGEGSWDLCSERHVCQVPHHDGRGCGESAGLSGQQSLTLRSSALEEQWCLGRSPLLV